MSLPGVRTQWDLPAKMPHNPPVLHHTIRKRGRRNRDSPSVSYNAADTTSIRILTDIEISERAAVSCKPISPPSHPFTVSVSYHVSSTRGRRSSLLARLVVVLGVDLFGGISTLILPTMSLPGFRTQWDLPAIDGSTSSLPPRSTMPSRRTLLLPSQHPSSCHGR
jgi:hypothetical protein